MHSSPSRQRCENRYSLRLRQDLIASRPLSFGSLIAFKVQGVLFCPNNTTMIRNTATSLPNQDMDSAAGFASFSLPLPKDQSLHSSSDLPGFKFRLHIHRPCLAERVGRLPRRAAGFANASKYRTGGIWKRNRPCRTKFRILTSVMLCQSDHSRRLGSSRSVCEAPGTSAKLLRRKNP
jgi:hypothetical protein